MMIAFNPVVDAGTIIQIIGLAATAIALYYGMKGKIDLLSLRMIGVEKQTDQLANILINMASEKARLDNQGERMNSIEAKLNELAHGEGFVMPRFTRAATGGEK